MIERILGIIVPVFSIVALGYLYGRRAKPDMGWVNRISMNVLAPALIFSALSAKSFDVVENRLLILGSIGVVLGSGLLAWPFTRLLHQDHRTFVPPMMFNNCGNMGLPLAALAFGQAGFSAMVALFTISNLLHFTLGAWMIDHHARFGSLLRNPMVWSTFAGFAFALVHPPLPEVAAITFKIVGDALIPMMLLSPVLGLDRTQQGLLILFGCLPPAVLNFMVAEQFKQEPGKVASIVLIGNLLSVVFVPIGLALALH